MYRSNLQRSTVRTYHVKSCCVFCPRKLVPFWSSRYAICNAYFAEDFFVVVDLLPDFSFSVRLTGVRSVCLFEVKLSHPQDRSRSLRFEPENSDYLVELQRQIGERANPQVQHRTYYGFTSWSQGQSCLQLYVAN